MKDYLEYEYLQCVRTADGVLEVCLGSGPGLTALDEMGHSEIARIWRDIDSDDSTRAVLVYGSGKGFSAGGSLDMVDRMRSDHELRMRLWRESRDLVGNMIACGKPVVSAVHGPAAGAGLAVALLADICIASRSARLIDGHSRLGVAAGDHATLVWPLLCGMAKAKQYLLLGDEVSGEEAARIGLVSQCVDDELLLPQARALAARLARGPKEALRMTKRSLNYWLHAAMPAFEASLAMEFLGFSGSEIASGLEAIRQRREPTF